MAAQRRVWIQRLGHCVALPLPFPPFPRSLTPLFARSLVQLWNAYRPKSVKELVSELVENLTAGPAGPAQRLLQNFALGQLVKAEQVKAQQRADVANEWQRQQAYLASMLARADQETDIGDGDEQHPVEGGHADTEAALLALSPQTTLAQPGSNAGLQPCSLLAGLLPVAEPSHPQAAALPAGGCQEQQHEAGPATAAQQAAALPAGGCQQQQQAGPASSMLRAQLVMAQQAQPLHSGYGGVMPGMLQARGCLLPNKRRGAPAGTWRSSGRLLWPCSSTRSLPAPTCLQQGPAAEGPPRLASVLGVSAASQAAQAAMFSMPPPGGMGPAVQDSDVRQQQLMQLLQQQNLLMQQQNLLMRQLMGPGLGQQLMLGEAGMPTLAV